MTPGVIARGQIASTSASTILTVGTGQVKTIATFVVTNETTTANEVTVFASHSGVDRRIVKVNLPGGIGKAIPVTLALGSYSPGYALKIQASNAAAFNYLLTGRTDSI